MGEGAAADDVARPLGAHHEGLEDVMGVSPAYAERDKLVAFVAAVYPSHLKVHPAEDAAWEKDWRWIVCVHGPTGQMTWHIHDSELSMFDFLQRSPASDDGCQWDGHTTEEKYQRLALIHRAKRGDGPAGMIGPFATKREADAAADMLRKAGL